MKIQLKLFLITSVITAAQTTFAGYGTNSFFVPAEDMWSPEKIEEAKTNAECQPSEKDPAGHWSPIFYGYQLSVRFNRNVFHTNEPVIAIIIFRNAGTNALHNFTPYGGDLDFKIVVKDENGNELPDSFVPGRTTGHSSYWPSGTQFKYESNLTKRHGLSKPGTYSVTVQRGFLNPNGNDWLVLSSGTATIKIIP
jgi:hypothetical protein